MEVIKKLNYIEKAKDGKVSLNGRYEDEIILSIQSLGDDD
jgi:hypothetical protein